MIRYKHLQKSNSSCGYLCDHHSTSIRSLDTICIMRFLARVHNWIIVLIVILFQIEFSLPFYKFHIKSTQSKQGNIGKRLKTTYFQIKIIFYTEPFGKTFWLKKLCMRARKGIIENDLHKKFSHFEFLLPKYVVRISYDIFSWCLSPSNMATKTF